MNPAKAHIHPSLLRAHLAFDRWSAKARASMRSKFFRPLMRCAWCNRDIEPAGWFRRSPEVTHGICPRCLTQARKSADGLEVPGNV